MNPWNPWPHAHARPQVSGGSLDKPAPPTSQLGVYVLVAPEPDRPQPYEDDEVCGLKRDGALEIEGETVELKEGQVVYLPAGADHRFVGNDLSVLVVFARGTAAR